MMTRTVTLSVLVAAITIGGAASAAPQQTQTTHYSKQGATQQQFMKDRGECIQQAQQKVSQAYGAVATGTTFIKCDAVPTCLAARGYVVDAKGNLAAPPGTEPACVN